MDRQPRHAVRARREDRARSRGTTTTSSRRRTSTTCSRVAGKGKKARIAEADRRDPGARASGEQAEDLYMLKAALYLAGDRRYEKDLKAVDTSPIVDERINSWSFYSDRRRRGFMLSTFHDLFGNDPAGELLAQRVAEIARRRSRRTTTTPRSWCGASPASASGCSRRATKGIAGGKLTADGTMIDPAAKHEDAVERQDVVADARVASTSRSRSTSRSSAAGLWLVINSEGVRPNGDYKVGGNGLSSVARVHDARLDRDRSGEGHAAARRSAVRRDRGREHERRSRSRTSRSSIGCRPASRSRTRGSAARRSPTGSRTRTCGRSTS